MLLKKGVINKELSLKPFLKLLKIKNTFFRRCFRKRSTLKKRINIAIRTEAKNVELKHRYVLDEARESVFLHEVTSVYSKYEENFSSTKPKISKQKVKSIAYLGRFLFFGVGRPIN